MHTIYLDNAATTPVRDEVLSAMIPYLQGMYGNPSSIHHKGREAFDAVEKARDESARALRARATELIFTSGGTEANNLAIKGTAYTFRETKKHILVSAIEHSSILKATSALSTEGFEVEYIPVDTDGLVQTKEVLSRVRKDTALISLMYANNEIGTIQPIAEISKALRVQLPNEKDRPLFHTDACQAPGQLPITPSELGVDLMTLNGGKVYGPKGAGLLYIRDGVSLTPLMHGGEQERSLRAGTENVAGIVGLSRALTLAMQEEKESAQRLTTLRDSFISSVMQLLPDTTLNGHPTQRLANNIHFSFPSIEGESLVLLLDTFGICSSTGSACNAHDLLPSHVLRAIQQKQELLHGSLRITLGRHTSEEDLAFTAVTLKECVARLRALSPLTLTL